MTETIMCPRCGQKMKSAHEITLHDGTCGVEVCEMCHDYLRANPEALERFEILSKEGAPHVKKRNTWTPEMDEMLISMSGAGAKGAEIAEALGVSVESIYSHIKMLKKKDGATVSEPENAKSVEEYIAEIERLHDYVTSLIAERDELLKRNTELQEKATAAENAASELCADLIAAQRASARNMLGSTLLDILRLELQKHRDEAERISTAISVIERVQGTAAVEDA